MPVVLTNSTPQMAAYALQLAHGLSRGEFIAAVGYDYAWRVADEYVPLGWALGGRYQIHGSGGTGRLAWTAEEATDVHYYESCCTIYARALTRQSHARLLGPNQKRPHRLFK